MNLKTAAEVNHFSLGERILFFLWSKEFDWTEEEASAYLMRRGDAYPE